MGFFDFLGFGNSSSQRASRDQQQPPRTNSINHESVLGFFQSKYGEKPINSKNSNYSNEPLLQIVNSVMINNGWCVVERTALENILLQSREILNSLNGISGEDPSMKRSTRDESVHDQVENIRSNLKYINNVTTQFYTNSKNGMMQLDEIIREYSSQPSTSSTMQFEHKISHGVNIGSMSHKLEELRTTIQSHVQSQLNSSNKKFEKELEQATSQFKKEMGNERQRLIKENELQQKKLKQEMEFEKSQCKEKFTSQLRQMEEQHDIEKRTLEQRISQLESQCNLLALQLNETQEEKRALEIRNQKLLESFTAMDSGSVVNSDTQRVLDEAKQIMSEFDNQLFTYVCDLSFDERGWYYLSNSIFNELLTMELTHIESEQLFQLSMHRLNEIQPSVAETVSQNPDGYKQVVDWAMKLYITIKSLKFPKISLLWIGHDNVTYSSNLFEIGHRITEKDDAKQGTTEFYPMYPAIALGEARRLESKGKVLQVDYQ